MAFEWTAHRFSGGLLALDLVNSVVCRGDPARRADRFENSSNVSSFAGAASRFRRSECNGLALVPPRDDMELAAILTLREAINDWMRPQANGREPSLEALPQLFAACAAASEVPVDAGQLSLGRAAALSAMQLLQPGLKDRIKICPNCDWLFVDRSKNKSRLWCDMSVCGNRAKARAHYHRHRNSLAVAESTP